MNWAKPVELEEEAQERSDVKRCYAYTCDRASDLHSGPNVSYAVYKKIQGNARIWRLETLPGTWTGN